MEEEYDHNSEEEIEEDAEESSEEDAENLDEQAEEKIEEDAGEDGEEDPDEETSTSTSTPTLTPTPTPTSPELDVDEEILADLQDLDNDIGPREPSEDEGSDEESEEFIEDEMEIGEEGLDIEESSEEAYEEGPEDEEGDEESVEDGIGEGLEGDSEDSLAPDMEITDEAGGEAEGTEGTEETIGIAEFTEAEQVSEEVNAHSNLKNVVEGALFVAGRPVSIEELNAKTDIRKRDLVTLLEELSMDYLVRSTALELVNVQDKFSLQIKPEYTPRVKKFATGGLIPDRILKTLTIIALKQPLMKSMLIKLRGSTAYEHVKFLLDRGYIEAYKKGRSHELLTTDQFADTFGLSRDIETLKKQMIIQLGLQDG
ncbi:MAG: SMC-Scp complex subunit ScpB [Promethearchaeota archaeon]